MLTANGPLMRVLPGLLLVVAVGAACTYVSWPVMVAPNDLFPSGIDTMGHLGKVAQVALRWRQMEFGDWFPEWYMGATAVQYYPPLSIWIAAIVQVVAGNILITYKILVWSCLFLGGVAVARLTKFLGGSLAACLVASILYSTGSYTMFTVFFDGTLGRAISLPMYPMLLQALITWCDSPSFRKWLWCVLLVFAMVLAHAMHAYLLFVTAAVYMVIWCFRYKGALDKVVQLLEIAIIGVALTAFWALPGATQMENPGIPWSPPEMAGIRSIDLSVLLAPSSPRASTVMFAAAVIGVALRLLRRRDPIGSLALMISLVFTVSLVYGPRNPVYNFLPMNRSLAPLRFINSAFLPAAIGAGFFTDELSGILSSVLRRGSSTAVRILVASLVVILSFTVNVRLGLPLPRDYAPLRTLLSEIPSCDGALFSTGRVAEELPMIGGESAFFPAQAGLAITAGWNIEGTVHIYTLHNHNLAYFEGYPEYVLRNWYLWNARSALVDEKYTSIMDLMIQSGWREVDRRNVDGYGAVLLAYPQPSTYLMSLTSDVLVIGRSSFYVSSLFPWVAEGREPNPLKYPDAYLELFDCIVLYDLPALDVNELEEKVIQWVRSGKTVIVDLSVSDSISSLLGVEHRDIEFADRIEFSAVPDEQRLYGPSFSVGVKGGRGATYEGLDHDLLTVRSGEELLAVCGYRELQYGNVYFVGGHVPRLVTPEEREQAKMLLGPLLDLVRPDKDFRMPAFPADSVQWTHDGLSFTSTAAVQSPVVVSVTYTPRWHALVDGQPSQVYSYENLILLDVPAGVHTVELRYGGTMVTRLGWAVTAVSLVYLVSRRRLLSVARSYVQIYAKGSD